MGMIVGLRVVELNFPYAQPIKEKRRILVSLKTKLHNRFDISIVEADESHLWQKKTFLGVASVGNEAGRVNQTLNQVYVQVASRELSLSQIDLI